MKVTKVRWKNLVLVFIFLFMSGCYYYPATGNYYKVLRDPGTERGVFDLDPRDQTFVMQIHNNTPFDLYDLPRTERLLYNKGYDQVRRRNEADFVVELNFSAGLRENPELRASNTVGGAMLGAATGAIIGGALGDPGTGAAIGAASGGALGLVSPAATSNLTVDLNVYSLTRRNGAHRSLVIDLATVPPFDVRRVADIEISKMLQDLPPR